MSTPKNPLAEILGLDDLELEILSDYERHGAIATERIMRIVKHEASRRRRGEPPITGEMVQSRTNDD